VFFKQQTTSNRR